MSLSLASDPAVLALFDRVCTLICAKGSGITLKQLSAANALARAVVSADHDKAAEHAASLKIDPEALR